MEGNGSQVWGQRLGLNPGSPPITIPVLHNGNKRKTHRGLQAKPIVSMINQSPLLRQRDLQGMHHTLPSRASLPSTLPNRALPESWPSGTHGSPYLCWIYCEPRQLFSWRPH